MKRLLTLVAFFATLQASAQQVNPVPDYVFRNQMSVGRNAVTDTAAYFSIGPRYGATKGFMPPIVGDTATFSSGKRNGLLIFSVQKNKFLYWDSVRVQWSDMAGSSGAYIVAGDTSAMLAPYLRKADTTAMLSPYYRSATASAALALKLNISDTSSMLGNYIRHAGYGLTKSGQSFLVDTLNIATRAWRQKGLDSLAALEVSGSGTTNYVAKFTASSTIGNSQIFDNGTSVGIGTASPNASMRLHVSGQTRIDVDSGQAMLTGVVPAFGQVFTQTIDKNGDTRIGTNRHLIFRTADVTERLRITSGGNVGVGTNNPVQKFVVSNSGSEGFEFVPGASSNSNQLLSYNRATSAYSDLVTRAATYNIQIGTTNAAYIFANGRVGINTTTDAGYQLDINGTLRSVNGANFATTSGNVGIGTTSPTNAKLVVEGTSAGTVGAIMSTDVSGTTSFVRVVGDVASQNLLNWQTGTALRFATSTQAYGTFVEHARINSAGELLINTTTDAGDYKLQVSGNIYNTGSAVLAATSGNVGIGTASPALRLHSNSTGAASPATSGTSQTGALRLSNNFSATVLDFGFDISNNAWMQVVNKDDLSIEYPLLINQNGGDVIVGTATDAGTYAFQVAGNIYNTGSAVLAATSGNVGVGTSTPTATASKAINIFGASAELHFTNSASGTTGTDGLTLLYSASDAYFFNYESGFISFGTANTERGRINSAGEWIIDASGTDAGDYKLQVVGNARIGTGKLDIASNTTFGLGVARSGTSEVAGQIYNSNGILYLGAESSAGGQIFSGSSAYAAVIGSGANYPLQFATNNITRATMTTSGNLLLGFTTDSYFLKLQVNGSIFSNNQVLAQGVNAQIAADSSANISPLYISNQSLTGSSAQGLFYGSTTWNTTGNPSLIDLAITNTASGSDANYIKISDGSNIFRVTKAAEVVTAAPTGGSIRKWKLGEAATVSPTSPNRTIRVEIDGTVYYLHAKTTND